MGTIVFVLVSIALILGFIAWAVNQDIATSFQNKVEKLFRNDDNE